MPQLLLLLLRIWYLFRAWIQSSSSISKCHDNVSCSWFLNDFKCQENLSYIVFLQIRLLESIIFLPLNFILLLTEKNNWFVSSKCEIVFFSTTALRLPQEYCSSMPFLLIFQPIFPGFEAGNKRSWRQVGVWNGAEFENTSLRSRNISLCWKIHLCGLDLHENHISPFSGFHHPRKGHHHAEWLVSTPVSGKLMFSNHPK